MLGVHSLSTSPISHLVPIQTYPLCFTRMAPPCSSNRFLDADQHLTNARSRIRWDGSPDNLRRCPSRRQAAPEALGPGASFSKRQ